MFFTTLNSWILCYIDLLYARSNVNRRRATAVKLLTRAEASGYKGRPHKKQDQVKDKNRHNDKTKKNHNGTLNRHVLWRLAYIERDHIQHGIPAPTEEEVRAQYEHDCTLG